MVLPVQIDSNSIHVGIQLFIITLIYCACICTGVCVSGTVYKYVHYIYRRDMIYSLQFHRRSRSPVPRAAHNTSRAEAHQCLILWLSLLLQLRIALQILGEHEVCLEHQTSSDSSISKSVQGSNSLVGQFIELTKNSSGGIGLCSVDLVNFLTQEKVWKQILVPTNINQILPCIMIRWIR